MECTGCIKLYQNDELHKCMNCTSWVCSSCSYKCNFCKNYACIFCQDDFPIMTLNVKKRYAIIIPGYGIRVTDKIEEFKDKYEYNEVFYNYMLCYNCTRTS